jgi:hypothetical protein
MALYIDVGRDVMVVGGVAGPQYAREGGGMRAAGGISELASGGDLVWSD